MSILMILIFVCSCIGISSSLATCHLRVEMPRHTVEVLECESETLECEYFAEESCNFDYLEWCISRDGVTCTTIVQTTDSAVYWLNYKDYYSTDGNNLVIDKAKPLHEGEYRCIVEMQETNDQESLNLYVLVPFAPTNISISVDELPIIEGNDVLLTCKADGIPTPTYCWTQNGVELSDGNKYKINEDGSELTILCITEHESEYYNCSATNEKGSKATAVFIDVYYEPRTEWPLCEVHVETNENYIAEGDFAELTCRANGGNPPPQLEWYNNSQALPECTSTTDDNGVVTETVSCWTLTPYDNGKMYECKGNHDANKETLNCFTEVFDVKYFPTWQTCSHTEGDQFEEDGYFTLTCKSDGNPLATLKWINGTDPDIILCETKDYDDDDETAINEFSWTLTRGDNQVFFKCHAFNDIKGNKLECITERLIVHFAPLSVSMTGYTDTARKGDRLKLSCVTDSSNPVSTISWYKNNQLITDDDHEEIQEENVKDGSFHGNVTEGGLHFDVLASHNDNEFSCNTTRIGYSEEDSTNSVTVNVYFPPSEPDGCTINLSGYSAPVVEGDDLILTCTSCSGNPTPIIEWFEDEHKITSGLGDIDISPGDYHGEISVQDLTLHLTYQHHGQRFRCESFNEEFTRENDRVVSINITLDVHYAPFVKNEEENRRHAVNLTDNADLTCEINSNPEVEISWYDNNNETIINGTGKFLMHGSTTDTITTGVLTILNVSESDFGDYRCHGINNINEVNFTINLSGKRRPYPAYDVTVTNKTEDSLTLTWTPGFDGGLPQQFKLEYRENRASTGTSQRTKPTTNTTDTIHELLDMTEYHITVVSYNNIDESHSDPPTIESTLPATPKSESVLLSDSGDIVIIVPDGACVKVEISNGTHWINYPIDDPCEDKVTIQVEGSGALLIYFCTNDSYTECGAPLHYTYNIPTSGSWIIALSILIPLIIAAAIAVVILAILVWRNEKENKQAKQKGSSASTSNDYFENTTLNASLLPTPPNKSSTDVEFSSVVNDAVSQDTDQSYVNTFISTNPTKTAYSTRSTKEEDKTTEAYAVVDKPYAKKDDTDHSKQSKDGSDIQSPYAVVSPGKKSAAAVAKIDSTANCDQYAIVDIKKKKTKKGKESDPEVNAGNIGKDVYADVDKKKKKDKKSKQQGKHGEQAETGTSSENADVTPPFMKGEFSYANVSGTMSQRTPSNTGGTADNGAYEDVVIKKKAKGGKPKKTKEDEVGDRVYDDVYEKNVKSNNNAQNSNDSGSTQKQNVEGLVYADLDLKPTSKPKPVPGDGKPKPPQKPPDESVAYAAIDFSKSQ